MTRPKRLYDFPFSGNGYKIRLALARLGIEVEYEVVDLLTGETRAPAFLARNPMGQIPVLELGDGTFLRESNAILFWLAEGTWLMPNDRLGRTRILQGMFFEQNNIDKVTGRARFLRRYPHVMPATPADFDHWRDIGNYALDILGAELAGHPFVLGDAYSAADICLYGHVHCAAEAGIDMGRHPAVEAWLRRVRAQPGHIPMALPQTSA
jgi:glutathione S-transferase